jgi:hypothetical protein
VVPESDHKKFELLTAETTFEFYAEGEKDLLQWTALLEDICHNLVHKAMGSPKEMQRPEPSRVLGDNNA